MKKAASDVFLFVVVVVTVFCLLWTLKSVCFDYDILLFVCLL